MVYKLVTKTESNMLVNILLILVAVFAFSSLMKKKETFKIFSGSSKDLVCSKKCCFTGWPNSVPINDDRVKDSDIGTKFSTSNMNCNDGINDTGCICVPK